LAEIKEVKILFHRRDRFGIAEAKEKKDRKSFFHFLFKSAKISKMAGTEFYLERIRD
jgi:hypothetical protein|tara:strand:- start:589 stop:759 length:171 start_codon:yes stop_codon:yes gene_type:complete